MIGSAMSTSTWTMAQTKSRPTCSLARCRTYALADQIGCGEKELGLDATREAIQCRILASELSLRASQAAMLHTGAAGYRVGAAAERKLREVRTSSLSLLLR